MLERPKLGWGPVALAFVLGGVPSSANGLTFADRVAAQESIERVYHSHREGSAEPFRQAVPRHVLQAKVRKTLELSLALEHRWGRSITSQMLERETERMLRQSKMPDRLRELFAALGDDPVLVQECLVRAVLVDRLTAHYFAYDRELHAEARRDAERLRGRLTRGEIDPHAPHPRRFESVAGPGAPAAIASGLRVGEIGPLREDPLAFVIDVPLSRDAVETRVARYVVAKETREAWLREASPAWGKVTPDVVASEATTLALEVPQVPGVQGCAAGKWDPLTDHLPRARAGHSAVWTGSELIVWAGVPGPLATADRYDPATDASTHTSTANAPVGRFGDTAVWTGQEMIVWGGRSFESESGQPTFPTAGGRYDPALDRWVSTSTLNAPRGRDRHTAVWTGGEMIVWGGFSFDSNDVITIEDTGGRYDPALDRWLPTSTSNAPEARQQHVAVWTGSEVLVWGGRDTTFQGVATGGRYAPLTDSWVAMTDVDAPPARATATAVWTGGEMIVWGGSGGLTETGGRYDPVTDSWSPTSTTGAPEARYRHSAVWTGTEMVVWGGFVDSQATDGLASGGAYDPAADSWRPTADLGAPRSRYDHTSTWTGSEMIVWGGLHYREALSAGGRYDPATDAWTPTSVTQTGAPTSWSLAENHEAVWTGSEMVVWTALGEGARYDPATASWSEIGGVAPMPAWLVVMVWSGSEVIVWSGVADSSGRYDPATDTWVPMSVLDAPPPNRFPTAVWTGTEMITWSGTQESPGRGGRYDPATDRWTPVTTLDAPIGRWYHTAVWTGSEMIVWGGFSGAGFAEGGRYDPVLDRWQAMNEDGAPDGRYRHTAVWTGSEMIVWGGAYPDDPAGEETAGTGGRYDPATDRWAPVSTSDAPWRREWPTAVWTGDEMIVWGGNRYIWPNGIWTGFNSGGHYDPITDTWRASALEDAPPGRAWHQAFWTGESLLVWGGRTQGGSAFIHLDDGGLYTPLVDEDVDGVCAAADCDDGDPNNWTSCATCDDGDADTWYSGCDAYATIGGPDCDDGDAGVHPGAAEVNDGLDNQCPGEAGHGAVDEISGATVFTSAARLEWVPQAGATLYEVAQASAHDFGTECLASTTMDRFHDDPADPAGGAVWFYLARAVAGNTGSWGLRSDGVERTVPCASGR